MKRKNWITLCLCAMLVICPALAVGADPGPVANYEEAAVQEPAITQYQRLQWSFEQTGYTKWYGGAFIREDGLLVVLMTEINEETKTDLARRTGGGRMVLRQAEYSWLKLGELMDDIYQVVVSDQSDIPLFYNWWISDSDNRVVVALETLTPAEIARFRRTVSAHPAITFEQGYGMNINT